MTQKLKNSMGLNRSFGNAIPTEADDNVPNASDGMRGGKSRTIGPIKGRYTFRTTAIGAGTKKLDSLGKSRTFVTPQEDERDPYKVNKNAG